MQRLFKGSSLTMPVVAVWDRRFVNRDTWRHESPIEHVHDGNATAIALNDCGAFWAFARLCVDRLYWYESVASTMFTTISYVSPIDVYSVSGMIWSVLDLKVSFGFEKLISICHNEFHFVWACLILLVDTIEAVFSCLNGFRTRDIRWRLRLSRKEG